MTENEILKAENEILKAENEDLEFYVKMLIRMNNLTGEVLNLCNYADQRIVNCELKINDLKNDLKTDESKVRSYVAEKFPGNRLDDEQVKILVDYNYNEGLSKFPKFVKAVVTKDWETAKKEYKRYAGGKELTDRNTKFYNKFLSNKSNKKSQPTDNGSQYNTIGKTLYPRKTSGHDFANVRTEPVINNGWFDNIIDTITWPNPVGKALSKKVDDQGYTWYYVELPKGTSLFNTNGWVRFDVITINKDEKYR
jgi:hypothetical protein